MGKTTSCERCGNINPMGGQIFYKGQEITDQTQSLRVRNGISMIPEGRQLYFGMTVEDNLLMGPTPEKTGKAHERLEWVLQVFPSSRRGRQQAGTLSGGKVRCAPSGGASCPTRSFCCGRTFLGLAPVVVDLLVGSSQRFIRRTLTILLVDQDVQTALDITKRAY